ncbi:Na+/H+ antiporter subunit E [Methylocaldum sp.]|uniref:Na+/H+ antiporter subunit E n=1 Tax=Methylocaldum sp. TaxID=1969727 RepID=UPI002D4ED47C|nr:Na+/H+ antiporter subunit E [Methylocaldum sp.]HYE35915.1 Na+/H+ antiporter subunit E [Methylocaldum sp.]
MFDFFVKSGLKRTLFLALCWWALTEDLLAWAFGGPVILLALASSFLLGPPGHRTLHSLPRFLGFFLWHSLRGGIDVARRALHPQMPLAPALVAFPLRLDDEAACVLLVNTINLLPGTVVAEFEEQRLLVHVLDRRLPILESLRTVEERVADLFSHSLDDSGRTPRA